MAEVIVNVKANTSDATQNVDDLNNSLNDTSKAAEKASEEINVAEGRIKALGGAINLVGGSVEILAGGLALSGALTEEQAERFEAAAVGAIAFADGTKRVFEGVKELKEGIQLLGGAQKIATAATKAFGIAMKVAMGPVGIALLAIGAISAAIVLLKDRFEVVNKVAQFFGNIFTKVAEAIGFVKTETEKFQEAQGELAKDLDFELKLLQAQGAGLEDLLKKEKALLEAKLNATKVGTEERIAAEQELQLFEARAAKQRADAAEKEKQDALKRQEELRQARETELKEFTDFYLKLLGEAAKKRNEALAKFNEDLAKDNEEVFEANQKAMEARMKQSTQMIEAPGKAAQASIVETASANLFAYNELAQQAVGDSVEAFGQLFSALADVTGDGNEEAFEKSKKFKIAEVVTSSIQAAFQAFGAAQQFGPILGPILGAAQVAAIAVASNKAIQDIKSSSFDGGGSTPSLSVGGGGVPAGFTPGGLGGGSQTLVTGVPTPEPQPMRAYVVTGDVVNGMEAQAQLNSRRTFGPG